MTIRHRYREIKEAEGTTVTVDSKELKRKLTEDIHSAMRTGNQQGRA